MAGVSGVGIGVATIGGLLAYAGFRGVNPAEALREIASGKPPSAQNTGADLESGYGEGVGFLPNSQGQVYGSGSPLVLALGNFTGDKYSQARRWQNGYSDCSSFIGKGFKAIGITPPGSSTTFDYMNWSKLTKVVRTDVQPGDLVCNYSHIICVIDSKHAIGQENTRVNVQVDTIENLMSGTGSFTCLRYTGWGGSAVQPIITQGKGSSTLGMTE